MRKILVTVSCGYSGCDKSDSFEVEDDATESDIKEIAFETMLSLIDWTWYEENNNQGGQDEQV